MLRLSLLVMILLCCAAQPVTAHKLLVMAWVQGDQLMGEAAFGDGSFAANAKVTVLDGESMEELLEFNADAQGIFQSALPSEILARGNPLLVRASDGAGHLAEYVVDAQEFAFAAQADSVVAQAEAHGEGTGVSIDQELIARMVQEAVRQEVAPLRRDIIALTQSKPGITEILGGIGYIIGLASLGFWLLRKR